MPSRRRPSPSFPAGAKVSGSSTTMMDKPDGEEMPVTQNFLSATVTECDYMGNGR